MRIFFFIAVLLAGIWYFVSDDTVGFVTLPPADGHGMNTVYIVAPKNCSGFAARRADGLARRLAAAGISAVRSHQVEFSQLRAQAQAGNVPQPIVEQALRIEGVMSGTLPIVFVNGRAKNNPTLEEVVAEYKGVAR